MKRAEAKAGYLSVYWTTKDESVFFALSDNRDPLKFSAINSGSPVATPTVGTKAVRDTSIIAGEGENAGKYWIIGTDLNIGSVSPLDRHSFFLDLLLTARQPGTMRSATVRVAYTCGRALTWSIGARSIS
jgi:hypothetical protein